MKRTATKRVPSHFGTWLKLTRGYHDMTLQAVEDRTGISKSHLSELENGVRPNPTLETAKAISGAFGLELWRVLKSIKY